MTISLVAAAGKVVLIVFAAASLHAAFPELGKRFESMHPGLKVRFAFNGSQLIEAQLAQGAQVDIFASADQRWMDKAVSDGLVTQAVPFATNSLVIAASKGSSVQSARDLIKPGVRVVLCAQAVPCGRYARALLGNMSSDPQFVKGYDDAVLHNVVSEEENVESVLAKVSLGEADAGIVYHSDVLTRSADVRTIEPPSTDQPAIVYPIAVVKTSGSPDLAGQFVTFVRSTQGQDILRRFGFNR